VTERSGAVEPPLYIVSCGGGTGLHDRPVSGNGGLLVVWFPRQGQDLVRRLAEACRFMAEEFAERATPVRLFSSPTARQRPWPWLSLAQPWSRWCNWLAWTTRRP